MELRTVSAAELTELLRGEPMHVELTDEGTLYLEAIGPEGRLLFRGELAPSPELRAQLSAGAPPGLCRFPPTCRSFAHPEQLDPLLARWERLREAVLQEVAAGSVF